MGRGIVRAPQSLGARGTGFPWSASHGLRVLVLDRLMAHTCPRVPLVCARLSDLGRDFWTVIFRGPPSIRGSCPCWQLNESSLLLLFLIAFTLLSGAPFFHMDPSSGG